VHRQPITAFLQALRQERVPAGVLPQRPGAGDVSEIWARAVFYARCTALEDLAHGITTGQDAYVRRSLAALDWLPPA
jgi:hypothetical protein